jgi:hypothetical protein
MQTFIGQMFRSIVDTPPLWGNPKVYQDFVLADARFDNCALSFCKDPAKRTVVRNAIIRNSTVKSSAIYPAIIEDVIVEELRTITLLQAWGAVFKHVTFRGQIGAIMLSDKIGADPAKAKAQPRFDETNRAYYQETDWAIDITEATFKSEPDLRGVPGELIRRDPTDQCLIVLDRVRDALERNVALIGTDLEVDLRLFLEISAYPSVVWAAPRGSRDYPHVLGQIKRLRDLGVAE